jgi:hypothetical protein
VTARGKARSAEKAAPMNDPSTPGADPHRKWGKWVTLVALAALAALMYFSIIFKTVKLGF